MASVTAVIENAGQVLTCAPGAPDLVGARRDVVVAISGDVIIAVGSRAQVEANHDLTTAQRIDAAGGLVMPGFVDCHTHLVFHQSRVEEYAHKVRGATGQDLARLGIATGISATVRMSRDASRDELVESAVKRLDHMLACGTTTVESKSGYGLSTMAELKLLEVNRELGRLHPVDIVSTFLGAHEFPEDKSRASYIDEVVQEMIPAVCEAGLAEFNDVYCDEGYFTVAESRRILEAGAEHGLKIKIHTDAYSHIGGSALAAELRAVSADHLNWSTAEEHALLRDSSVVGVVMPGLDFAVGHTRPFNARAMLDAGMTLALATDMCPACWLESMPFVVQLACRLYRFSPSEAIRAATYGGALALDRAEKIGSLEPGKTADITIFAFEQFEDMAYRLGRSRAQMVIKSGRIVFDNADSRH